MTQETQVIDFERPESTEQENQYDQQPVYPIKVKDSMNPNRKKRNLSFQSGFF